LHARQDGNTMAGVTGNPTRSPLLVAVTSLTTGPSDAMQAADDLIED
jgi:hypothetical protein